MIPLRDTIPPRTTPVVNYAIIAVCALVFALELRSPEAQQAMIDGYGMVPRRVFHPDEPVKIRIEQKIPTPRGITTEIIEREVGPAAVPPWLTLFTCIFLHGGWGHILGNLWFLHIFGDNVEDRFGRLGFLAMYLASGVAASVVHLLMNPDSPLPTVGASGAISGVMGAYFVLYPRSQILTLVPLFVFLYLATIPAPVFLAIWFLIQFLQGTMTAGSMVAGVAWWAHIGGFVFGLLLAAILNATGCLRPPNRAVLPSNNRVLRYRLSPNRRI